jgi:maltokinase
MAEWPRDLEAALPVYLAAQRWFAGSEPPPDGEVAVEAVQSLWEDGGNRALWQVVVDVGAGAGAEPAHYQMLLGMRPAGEPADFLHGHESAVLGSTDSVYLYDATLDTELAKIFLEFISKGELRADRTRPMSSEQSNTSMVFDDRIILKVFRRLWPGRNPDVEATTALAQAGFDHVPKPLIEWRDGTYDLAFGQEFLAGGSEGWALALTSLRELFTSRDANVPADSGGDFAAEAGRLGKVTAEMHVALHEVFGSAPDTDARLGWATMIESLPDRLDAAGRQAEKDLLGSAGPLLDRLRAVGHPGPAFRVHGDFHLGQVMRTDRGWYILDFEGEPAKPLAERIAPASPLKDVTGMLRSFHYASRYALVERAVPEWSQVEPDARAWEAHNRQAFLDGYQSHQSVAALLPDAGVAPAVMTAYELDKALYELEYELSHRPEWVSIPLDALERLVKGGASA